MAVLHVMTDEQMSDFIGRQSVNKHRQTQQRGDVQRGRGGTRKMRSGRTHGWCLGARCLLPKAGERVSGWRKAQKSCRKTETGRLDFGIHE